MVLIQIKREQKKKSHRKLILIYEDIHGFLSMFTAYIDTVSKYAMPHGKSVGPHQNSHL